MSKPAPVQEDAVTAAAAAGAEVAAAVDAAEAAADMEVDPAAEPARAFAFSQDGMRPAERLTGLERLGEKLARAFRDAIEPFARARAQALPPTIATEEYRAWGQALPGFIGLSHYRMRPLKGGMLIAIEADFVAALVESFYGGTSAAPRRHRGADFSASEELLLKRLRDRLAAILTEHWNAITPIELSLAAQETSIAHIDFVRPDEPVVVHRFGIATGTGETIVQIVYPHAAIRSIEARMASKVHGDDEHNVNDAWRQRMAAALARVSLPVRSVLARPEISVGALLALKVGDVIPIQLAPRTPLLAGQHRIAEGMIGEQDGRAAMMIQHVGNGE